MGSDYVFGVPSPGNKSQHISDNAAPVLTICLYICLSQINKKYITETTGVLTAQGIEIEGS